MTKSISPRWPRIAMWVLLPVLVGVAILYVYEWPHGAVVHTLPSGAPVHDAATRPAS